MTHNDINTDIRLVAAKMGRLLETIEAGAPVAMDELFTTLGEFVQVGQQLALHLSVMQAENSRLRSKLKELLSVVRPN